MLKTSSEAGRRVLSGATMGTRWSAHIDAVVTAELPVVEAAMAAAVAEVDAQMSLWQPQSDLVRLNHADPDTWVALPARLLTVLSTALEIGRASGGAFEIGMGDAVAAWGFGPAPASNAAIGAALTAVRKPAHSVLELDPVQRRARKHAPLTLDLNGIAKGYGVDRLTEVARAHGLRHALLAIDGELRALGGQADGRPWAVAVERPDHDRRAAQAMLELSEAAVATSGDYRHWVTIGAQKLSHTMDPTRGAPLRKSPASVTVVAPDCMQADAWATALMVMGEQKGAVVAEALGFSALFLSRGPQGVTARKVGPAFTLGLSVA